MKKVLFVVLLSLFVCGVVNAANVTGVWQGEYRDSYVEMTLKQTGKRIKGSMVTTEDNSGMWSIKGRIIDNEIRLIFTGIKSYSYDGDYTGTLEGDVMDFSSSYLDFGRIYECKGVK